MCSVGIKQFYSNSFVLSLLVLNSCLHARIVCVSGGNRGARGGDLIPKDLKEEVAKVSTHSRVSVLGDVRLMSLRERCRGPVEEIWFQRHVQRGHITRNTFQSFNGCPGVWRESREGLWRLGLGEWGDYIHILARHNHCQSSLCAVLNTYTNTHKTQIPNTAKKLFLHPSMWQPMSWSMLTLCVISHKDALLHSL